MKFINLLEQIVTEALGVPEGILEASEDLYKDILKRLPSLKDKIDTSKNEFKLEFDNPKGYKINDLVIKSVSVTFPLEKKGRYSLNGAAVNPHKAPELYMYLNFIVPTNWDLNEVIFLFKENKKKLIPTISHEVMHVYDFYKRKHYNVAELGKYDVKNSNVFSNIYPIDSFLYLLYFTHYIENAVRPSQFASELENNKVSPKKFLEFLKDDNTYLTLKRAKNFSYEKLKTDLKKYIPEIELITKHYSGVGNTDEDKIDKILEMVRKYVMSNASHNHRNMVTSDVIGKMFGDKGRSIDLSKFLKKIGKFNNNDDFYKNEEKIFNDVGDKMIRKLSKLYDKTHNSTSFYHKLTKGGRLTKEELDIEGDLDLSNTSIKSLPNNLKVNGNLDLKYCTNLKLLPNNLKVNGDLSLIGCTKLESLPDGLEVGNNIWLTNTAIAKKYTEKKFTKNVSRKEGIIKMYPGVSIRNYVYL